MCKAAYSFDMVANLKDMTTVSPSYLYKKDLIGMYPNLQFFIDKYKGTVIELAGKIRHHVEISHPLVLNVEFWCLNSNS